MGRKKNQVLFNAEESKNIKLLGVLLFFRMTGVFLVLPVFSALANEIPGAGAFTVGLAFGAYGLTQGLLQLPFGMLSDRFGRKRILAIAFSLFFAGTLICAMAPNIEVMILGRLLQGAGAVSSAIFALIADLTRHEVRTRANALLGMSIGVSFALSFLLAPFLGEALGLQGIFLLIALMAGLALLILLVSVKSPAASTASPPEYRKLLAGALSDKNLWGVFTGSLAAGCGLSAAMYLVPLELRKAGYETAELWKIYLPMLAVGVAFMVPSAIIAETKKKYKSVFFFGISLFLLSAVAGLWVFSETPTVWGLVLFLFVFFAGYNVFEPIFPSISTKLSTPEAKGTVSGVMNFFQFVGYFLGSSLAGLLYHHNPQAIFWFLAFLYIVFLFATSRMEINAARFT